MITAGGQRADSVLVTGIGVVSAIGSGAARFQAALSEGRIGARLAPAAGPGQVTDQVAARLPDCDLAGLLEMAGVPAPLRTAAERATARSSPALRAAAAAAAEAWCHAGLPDDALPGDQVALVVAGNNLTSRLMAETGDRYAGKSAYVPGRYALGYQDTDHVGTLSQVLGITGEGCTVGGASASGNLGLIHGSRLIELGAADACLVVGAVSDLSPAEWHAFVNLGAMAHWAPGTCPQELGRPFDAGRRGFVYGQAAAGIVLESSRSAWRRGARPLAVLAGYAAGLDANSLADPNPAGEARAMTRAMRMAGVGPAEVDYVNAHGTGSARGDDAELGALAAALGSELGPPVINATKGLTGHCLAAAGVLEAVAVVIQMRGGFVHPNANLKRPVDRRFRFAGPEATAATIGTALSNGFGFGGINSCVVFSAAGS